MHAMQGQQKYQLRASYLELYDEQITDLLAVGDTGQLTIREDVCNETARVYVEGLTEVELLNGEYTQHLKALVWHCREGHGAWARTASVRRSRLLRCRTQTVPVHFMQYICHSNSCLSSTKKRG